MSEEEKSDGDSSPDGAQFFIRPGFPFVFVPTSGFAFTNNQTEEEKQEKTSTDDRDESEQTERVDDENHTEKNDLRISQPEYGEFLKKMDFSGRRFIDVTEDLPEGTKSTIDDQIQDDEETRRVDDQIDELPDKVTQENVPNESQRKSNLEEDDDTSKQATQNYDLHENEKEDKFNDKETNEKRRSTSDDEENLRSIPRLNVREKQIEIEEQQVFSSSSSSDAEIEQVIEKKTDEQAKTERLTSSAQILLRRLSEETPDKKVSPQRQSAENWLSMLEKFEREHKERLERQQKQYEEHLRRLEENMKRRCDEYLTSNSFPSTKNEDFFHDESNSLRQLDKDLINQFYPSNANLSRTASRTNLPRSQSREDLSSVRLELSAKHAKHISDLKSYYEHEIEELTDQLNRNRMGNTANSTRQSMETIERINNENIRLHDEVKQLKQTLKSIQEENNSLGRKLDEFKSQNINRDIELKSAHRTIAELHEKIAESNNIRERQEERFRQVDRQSINYREENEKLKKDLQTTRERLSRLEDRLREQETSSKTMRQQILTNDPSTYRPLQSVVDEIVPNSTMSMNVPTSREYGRFTLSSSRYSSSLHSPREVHQESCSRVTINNGSDDFHHSSHSPRSLTRLNDYLNEKPSLSTSYGAPIRTNFSTRKSSSVHSRSDFIPDFIDNPIKHGEQLEEKFDDLLRRKRELEARMNRIPTRHLTSNDRQLLESLEREIDRVEQQISSVKLELRKLNILRTH